MFATAIGILFLLASGGLFVYQRRAAYYKSTGEHLISFSESILRRIKAVLMEGLLYVLLACGLNLIIIQTISGQAVFVIVAFIFIVKATTKMDKK